MVNSLNVALSASAAVIAAGATTGSSAQTLSEPTTLPPVTVSSQNDPLIGVAGWGDVPLSNAPFQATVLRAEEIRDRGIERVSDLSRVDPSVSNAYSSEGYWDALTVRGYVIDNRFNYRRDGLPVNAETSIPLDNKARIELLHGTSGLQAGTSAPGGLVNFVVKRPLNDELRSAQLAWRESRTLLGAVDISQRFGRDHALGLRFNASAERLAPQTRNANGERNLLAVASDWRLTPDTLLEAEFETSHRSQPSVPGFSLFGTKVPAPVDPRINLNNQPWSLPVVFDANSASLRFTQTLSTDWRWSAHLATQRLRTDDRVAFPFGFDCHPNSNFTFCDRYSPAGAFDLYDFRSANERRRTDAFDVSIQGKRQIGALKHVLTAGVLRSVVRNRFEPLANNYVGTGNVLGTGITPPDPTARDQNTDRDERSSELYARDAIAINSRLTAWLGVRHTRLARNSVRTDGEEATSYRQSFNTPWLAASYALTPEALVYASWGRGVESEVAPNRKRYTNRGVALPALKSRQTEVGFKGGHGDMTWNLVWFDIERPAWQDVGSDCFSDVPGDTCTRQQDGFARHRGVEASLNWRFGPWRLQSGIQALRARREGSQDATINGKRPTNVPATSFKLQGDYDVASVPGLRVGANLLIDGKRMVLPDNSLSIPGFGSVDASLRYKQKLAATTIVWRAGITNLFDRRAWQESPYQFSHVYLFPLPARSARLSAQLTW